MTIHITLEMMTAFKAYLEEPVDCYVDGKPILRRDTYPYTLGLGEVTFAAGYQAGQAAQTLGWQPIETAPIPTTPTPNNLTSKDDL